MRLYARGECQAPLAANGTAHLYHIDAQQSMIRPSEVEYIVYRRKERERNCVTVRETVPVIVLRGAKGVGHSLHRIYYLQTKHQPTNQHNTTQRTDKQNVFINLSALRHDSDTITVGVGKVHSVVKADGLRRGTV